MVGCPGIFEWKTNIINNLKSNKVMRKSIIAGLLSGMEKERIVNITSSLLADMDDNRAEYLLGIYPHVDKVFIEDHTSEIESFVRRNRRSEPLNINIEVPDSPWDSVIARVAVGRTYYFKKEDIEKVNWILGGLNLDDQDATRKALRDLPNKNWSKTDEYTEGFVIPEYERVTIDRDFINDLA